MSGEEYLETEKSFKKKQVRGVRKFISKEDHEVVVRNKEQTTLLLSRINNDIDLYKQKRTAYIDLLRLAKALECEKRDILIGVNRSLNELKQLNPGCCRMCGLQGDHPEKKFDCGNDWGIYIEDGALITSESQYAPLYWGKEFTDEEYNNLYCHRVPRKERLQPNDVLTTDDELDQEEV